MAAKSMSKGRGGQVARPKKPGKNPLKKKAKKRPGKNPMGDHVGVAASGAVERKLGKLEERLDKVDARLDQYRQAIGEIVKVVDAHSAALGRMARTIAGSRAA
jgi:hypothetical protein